LAQRDLLNLSDVSVEWRAFLQKTPQLWKQLSVFPEASDFFYLFATKKNFLKDNHMFRICSKFGEHVMKVHSVNMNEEGYAGLHFCPHLEELSLKLEAKAYDYNVDAFKVFGQSLQKLKISFSEERWPSWQSEFSDDRQFTQEDITQIIDYCPNLRSLSLVGVEDMTGDDFGIFELPHLTSLKLSDMRGISDISVFRQLLNGLPQLKEMYVFLPMSIGAIVHSLGEFCPQLEELELHGWALNEPTRSDLFYTDDELTEEEDAFESDHEEEDMPVETHSIDSVNTHASWQTYDKVTRPKMELDEGLKHLVSRCKNIKSLKLHAYDSVTDNTFRILAASGCCKQLEHLAIPESDITDAAIEILIEHCTNLVSLDLEECPLVSERCVIRLLEKNPKLRFFKAALSVSKDTISALISSRLFLEELNVSGIPWSAELKQLLINYKLMNPSMIQSVDFERDVCFSCGDDECDCDLKDEKQFRAM
jgi:hypothetical protein